MSIVQFLRIFWARRILILAATFSCLVGAYIVTLILPPRWQAHSRVMLNLMKPDPVTGQVVAGPAERVYASTQVELITDYAVAGQVADQLGWLSDPALIAAYQGRAANDKRDFRRWLAQLVIDNTKAEILEDSNILEITYTATTPDAAKGVADALRTAYLNASLAFQRDDAQRNAEWFSAQADRSKAAYDTAVAARTDYEKANGILMADDKTDVDSAHLQALAMQSGVAPTMIAPTPMQSSPSAIELAQVDAQIAEAAKTLGPNHPDLLALRARRQALAELVVKDQAAVKAAAGAVNSASAATVGALDRAVATQKARVLGKSEQIGKLTQLQSEVDLRHEEFAATAAKAAQFREQAAQSDSGLTPLGAAVTPKAPQFPNYWLIIPGSLFLGLAVGVLVALVMELFGRRVRGVEDLASVHDLPLLAVVAAPNPRLWPCVAATLATTRPAVAAAAKGRASVTAEHVVEDHSVSDVAFAFAPQLVTLLNKPDPRAEAIRALRTHVVAQHLHLGRRALAVCAASPGVGCTFIAGNLAVALSQIGVKTLLIDADLHHPSVASLITPDPPGEGLAHCLASPTMNFYQAIHSDVLPNLSVLFAGGAAADAQELLGGERFHALMAMCLRDFDATIIDTPPANRCSDARRVSSVVGYSLIVAARDKTFVEDVKTLAGQLQADHAGVIGTVLNSA